MASALAKQIIISLAVNNDESILYKSRYIKKITNQEVKNA